jgi:hypothetical protein
MLDRLGHHQRPHEVAKVADERMELKANRVGGEGAARQVRPFDRALSFFNPLLRRAVPIVEGHHALGRPGQIGDDEADPQIKLSGVPLDFRHHSAGLPTLRLKTEAGMVAAHLMRRSTDRALEQICSLFLQDPVAGSRIA